MARMDHNCVVVSLNQFFWLKSSSQSSNLQRLIPFLRVRHVLLTLSGSYLCGHSLFIFAVQHVKTIVSSYFYHILSFLCPWLQCPWFQCFNVHGFFIVSSHVPVTCRTRFKIILVLCLDLFLCGGSKPTKKHSMWGWQSPPISKKVQVGNFQITNGRPCLVLYLCHHVKHS